MINPYPLKSFLAVGSVEYHCIPKLEERIISLFKDIKSLGKTFSK